jgi:hypothetical protein
LRFKLYFKLKIDENTVITGSEDGYIRGVSVGPNKVLNYLGNHSDNDEIEAITKMALSHDQKYVATISYDNWIKFHNISTFVEGRQLVTGQDLEDDDNEAEEESKLSDENESWDGSDVEDMGQKKQQLPKKVNMKDRKKEIEKQKKINFFSDLTE